MIVTIAKSTFGGVEYLAQPKVLQLGGDASLLGNAEYYAAQYDYEKAQQKAQKQAQQRQRQEELAKEPATADPEKPDGREVFYDVVNFQPTKIKASTETAEGKTSGNRSVEADENSRRTAAESVEPDGRGLPETSGTSIAPEEAGVNGQAVENLGETVRNLA